VLHIVYCLPIFSQIFLTILKTFPQPLVRRFNTVSGCVVKMQDDVCLCPHNFFPTKYQIWYFRRGWGTLGSSYCLTTL